ncbi:MAG: hypothetical protein B6D56_00420 [Candidatus Omnitrophica bacterium 4484_70.1]|nr:MAG: hypothetical protein B6D56_00420 [Candidatus Omnitrophica bacterium 4484_70.1]
MEEKEFKKALNYTFLLLRYRERSCREIETRLKRKKFSSEVIKKVIDYLKENNFIDDKKFALKYVEEKLLRGFGKKLISFQLKRLGIKPSIIEETFKQLQTTINTQKILKELIIKLRQRKDKEKIFRYLYQRGFDFEEIERAYENL